VREGDCWLMLERKGKYVCGNEWMQEARMQVQGQVYQNATKSFEKAGFWRLQKVGPKVLGPRVQGLLQPPVCASQHLKTTVQL
jgi:hypothetical protein